MLAALWHQRLWIRPCTHSPVPPAHPSAAMWAVFRHAKAMGRSTSRSAAMALVTRSTLLPRGGAAAGASAMTDLLLFERSMRRGFVEHLQGVCVCGVWG